MNGLFRQIAILAVALFQLPAARADNPAILDSLDLSNPASRTAHRMLLHDGSYRTDLAEVGTLFLPVAGVMLNPGGWVRVRMATDVLRGTSLLVTLATAPADYGKRQSYSVRINDAEVVNQSEVDPGGGVTRSFFVDLPGGQPSARIEIGANTDTQAHVTVSSLRTYQRVSAAPIPTWKEQMGLALVSRLGMGYGIDAGELRAIASLVPKGPVLLPQAAVLYNFCKRTAAENQKEIDRLVGLAEETNVPLRIAFQMGWGGTPVGVPDGAGGTFADLPYQQIMFDPDDKVDDPGLSALMGDNYDARYGLSTPNRWNNTPWLTFNHPRLNQFRRVRMTQALIAWSEARRRLGGTGKTQLLPLQLSTGDETVYWAKGVDDSEYTKLNNGTPRQRLMADFNPFVLADAIKDNVRLDPRDGLDAGERYWLHRNLSRQQQRIVGWMFEAMPAEPISLEPPANTGDKLQSRFAVDMPRRNLFTEPYAMPLFPMKGLTPFHPGLELGYVAEGRSGGEYWSGAQMLPWLLKERERGRIALPNLECSGAEANVLSTLQSAYACGARYATLYNWQGLNDVPRLLGDFQRSVERSSRYYVAETKDPKPQSPRPKLIYREYTAPQNAFGVNSIDVSFTEVQSMRSVNGRFSLPEVPNYGNAFRVTVGEWGLELGNEITATIRFGPGPRIRRLHVELPEMFSQVPGKRYFVSVERADATTTLINAGPAPAEVWLASDIGLERKRSEAISEWQDAADILASLQGLHSHSVQSEFAVRALSFAAKLFEANRPQETYAAAIKAEQLSLPASFELPMPGGLLSPYDIEVLCPLSRLLATVTGYSSKSFSVMLRGSARQTVTIRWQGKETKADLAPNVPVEISLYSDENKR